MSHQHNGYPSAILAISICLIIVGAEVACTRPSTATLEPAPVTAVTLSPTPMLPTEPSSSSTEPPPTETPPGTVEPLPASQGVTALLFLIDESGGVSGRWPQVPVTDEDGLRYDLVRFYLSLWEAYYSGRWVLSSKDKNVLDDLPRLYVGVAQFASTYKEVFPFTSASDLFGPKEWDGFRQRLLSPETMLSGFTDDWFRNTAYTEALTETVKSFPPDASRRILVLLTDGSFQGVIPIEGRLEARDRVRTALEQLFSTYGIEVHVLLLGEHMCRQGSDCPLSLNASDARHVDLDTWKEWSVSARAARPEEETAFEMMGNALADLLPGAHYHDGWLDGGEQTPLPFLGGTQRVRVGIVTSRQPFDGALHLRDEDSIEVDVRPQGPQWFHGEAKVPATDSLSECLSHQWTLELRENLTVYYWLVTGKKQVSIASLTHSPETVVLNKGQDMTVAIGLTTQPQPPRCYQLAVSVGDQEEMLDLEGDSESLNLHFTLPITLSWGLLLVRAQLVYTDEPEKSPRPVEHVLSVRFEPEIGRVMVAPSPEVWERGQGVVMTVPIPYAVRIPEFEAHFALFPERFDGDEPPHRPGCLPYVDIANAERLPDVRLWWDEGDTRYYQIVVPYEKVLDGCDYRHLRLRWTGGGMEGIKWTEVNRDSLPPHPTPSPAP